MFFLKPNIFFYLYICTIIRLQNYVMVRALIFNSISGYPCLLQTGSSSYEVIFIVFSFLTEYVYKKKECKVTHDRKALI